MSTGKTEPARLLRRSASARPVPDGPPALSQRRAIRPPWQSRGARKGADPGRAAETTAASGGGGVGRGPWSGASGVAARDPGCCSAPRQPRRTASPGGLISSASTDPGIGIEGTPSARPAWRGPRRPRWSRRNEPPPRPRSHARPGQCNQDHSLSDSTLRTGLSVRGRRRGQCFRSSASHRRIAPSGRVPSPGPACHRAAHARWAPGSSPQQRQSRQLAVSTVGGSWLRPCLGATRHPRDDVADTT